MLVTESGIRRLVRELQPWNAASGTLVTELGISRLLRELHPANAPSPMLVTELGMVKLLNDMQRLNVLSPIVVTELGISRLVNELQPLKAQSPILVTESGMLTVSMDLHSPKASSGMVTVLSGMIRATGRSATLRSYGAFCQRPHSRLLFLKTANTVASATPLSARVAESSRGVSPSRSSTTVIPLVTSSSPLRNVRCTSCLNSPTAVVADTSKVVTSPPASQL